MADTPQALANLCCYCGKPKFSPYGDSINITDDAGVPWHLRCVKKMLAATGPSHKRLIDLEAPEWWQREPEVYDYVDTWWDGKDRSDAMRAAGWEIEECVERGVIYGRRKRT